MLHTLKLPLFLCFLFLMACGTSHDDHDHDHDHDHLEVSDSHDHDEGHHHEGAVMIEPEKAAEFGIMARQINPATFSEVIKTGGRVEPAISDLQTVTAKKSGIVTLASGISQGASVRKGEAIASISSQGMEGGDVSAAARANLDAAKRELDRLTPLYNDRLITASEYNEAKRKYDEARALSAHPKGGNSITEISPTDGTLGNIFVTTGQYVEAGTPIAVVAKNTRLTLRADLPERYVSLIPSIKSANFRQAHSDSVYSIADLGGEKVSSSVNVTEAAGYLPLYFTFQGNGDILPGTFAEVYLLSVPRENILFVPRDALIELQGNKYVYEVIDGHAYEKKLVTTGASDGYNVEIKSGISPGETIVTRGATIVRMEETSAIAPPGHTHNH